MKTGRNAPCVCGSGKKYKKCCIDKGTNLIPPTESCILNSNAYDFEDVKAPLMTATNEEIMPVRFEYKIEDLKKLKECLNQLECITWNSSEEFSISYCKEARKINLSVQYNRVPKYLFPVMLALCCIKGDILYIDCRSAQRATEIFKFIESHISVEIIQVTNVLIVNKIFDTHQENMQYVEYENYDNIFAKEHVQITGKKELDDKQNKLLPEVESLVILDQTSVCDFVCANITLRYMTATISFHRNEIYTPTEAFIAMHQDLEEMEVIDNLFETKDHDKN